MKNTTDFKICVNCKNQFFRSKNLNDKQWNNTKFCSIRCAALYKKSGFKIGHLVSAETRKKIRERNKKSLYLLGSIPWNKGMKGFRAGTKRKPHSQETKDKIRKTKKGKPRVLYIEKEELGRRISKSKIGKPRYDIRGEKCHLWKGGICPINKLIRSSLEYKIWRRAVFERDNYTCIWCGTRSSKGNPVILHADHIKPFALYPELRFALDNGRTLCIECHKTTDTYLYRTKRKK